MCFSLRLEEGPRSNGVSVGTLSRAGFLPITSWGKLNRANERMASFVNRPGMSYVKPWNRWRVVTEL
jgi:hypothetical protein